MIGRRVWTLIVVALVTSPPGAAAQRQDRLTASHVTALEQWLDAVVTHLPGQRDAAVISLIAATPQVWRELVQAQSIALRTMTGRSANASSKEAKAIVALTTRAVQARGANTLLRRAAVLHADAAMLGGRMPMAETKLPSPTLLESRDGELSRIVGANGHWSFARELLDLLSGPGAQDDPFAAEWYHATTAYLMRSGQFGEAGIHLTSAADVLRLDARIAFDRGCLAETLGLPRSRLVLDTGRGEQTTPNADAERHYRRALELDKTLVEARIRLGRLLTLRARSQDALKELETAIAAKPEPALLFYAHLFAGRAARGLKQAERSAVHFKRALELYPDAQSALLGASQVALVRADLGGALAGLHRLETAIRTQPYDPWWDYHLGAGRQHDVLLRAMWARVQ